MYLEISLYKITRHMIESGNTGVIPRIGVMSWAGFNVDRATSRAFGTAGVGLAGWGPPQLLLVCHYSHVINVCSALQKQKQKQKQKPIFY